MSAASGSRERIMGKIKRALKAEARDPAAVAALEARLSAPRLGLVPDRAQLAPAAQVDLFQASPVTSPAADVIGRDIGHPNLCIHPSFA